MNSLKSDPHMDPMIRQALEPVAEAHPPEDVWRRIVAELEHSEPSHRGLRAFFKLLEGFSINPLTEQYCVGPFGRCLSTPITDAIGIRFTGQHIAS